MKKPKLSKAGFSWIAKMAWRDGRSNTSRLMLFMASIILGIAAVVSIQLFSESLQQNIESQSKSMMGADFIIDSRQKPNAKVQSIIDSLGADAFEVNFNSMALFPKNGESKLVKVRGIEGGFPFYGNIETEPVEAAAVYQEAGGALVDATLMLQYDLKTGDSIKLGKLSLPIAGALHNIPGSTAIATAVAPTVLIPFRYVEATELLQFGSRKEYQYFFVVPPSMDLAALNKKLNPILDAENADLDTHTGTSRRVGRSSDNVSKFLNLAAFIALLLGCIGIASSVHIYIREKLGHVAVLKCLGASRKQTFLIFLLQIAGIGFLGGLIGAAIGIALQQAFPYILQDFLPFEVQVSVSPQPILLGILLGVLMSVLFALLPLLGTWYVSPLEVLRVGRQSDIKPRKARWLTFTAIFLFIFLVSFWLLGDWLYALAFVIGVAFTFFILGSIASLFMTAVKNYFPKQWGFTARQSLLNLFRPNNQTMVLALSIGLGTFLISTLYFTKDILLAKTALERDAENPNIILLDVQPPQREAVANAIKEKGMVVLDDISLVTMRVHSIKGKLANDIRNDTTSSVSRWVLNHEFRTTYRDSLIGSEEVIKGEWVPEIRTGDPVVVSLSEDLARRAGVDIGDPIVFNVQGVLMETVVGSIRKVDWARMQMNFTVVFPKGVLENAPQFHVLATHVADDAAAALLQRHLVKNFPTISVIDLRQLYSVVENILDKISWVINFMAFFSILTGIIVLIGSVRTSKHQRIRESVLLRTMGAKSKQILRIIALEYLYLGILGSLIGILLSLVGSQILATVLFEEPFVPSIVPFVVFLPGITVLVLLIGLSNIRPVLNSPPLEVLRKEG